MSGDLMLAAVWGALVLNVAFSPVGYPGFLYLLTKFRRESFIVQELTMPSACVAFDDVS